MALEDRVRALEDEAAILRDQIRNTLLEIQEQILTHYYPDLRARETPPPDAALPITRSNAAPAAPPAFSGLQRVRLTDIEAEAAPEQSPAAAALDPLVGWRAGALAELPAPPPDGRPPYPESIESGSGATTMQLMGWASESIGAIGRARTARVIEIYAQSGYLTPEIKETLLQLAALGNEEQGSERVSLKAIVECLTKLNGILGHDGTAAALPWLMEEAKVG